MKPTDRFKEAVDLTTDLDLPEDMALPAQRKRHLSLILKDVVDPFDGGMERATLATVFGVREYTESKMFWESQETTGTGPNHSDSNDRRTGGSPLPTQAMSAPGISSMASKSVLPHPMSASISIQPQKQHHVSPQLHQAPSDLDGNQLQNTIRDNKINSNIPSVSTSPFVLPNIPAVSKFEDWLTTSSQVFSSKARVVCPSRSSPTNLIPQSQQQQQQQQLRHHQQDIEVAPPLVFLSYPPAIFDLLKSNTDDRIIIWGPSPQSGSNHSLTTLQQVPSKLGFSSNPTTTILEPDMSVRSRSSVRDSMKSNVSWINRMKQSIHSAVSLSSTSSSMTSNNGKTSLMAVDRQQKPTLRSRLSRRLSSKTDQHQQSHLSTTSNHPLTPSHTVIHAATVEKLLEILTMTLDYTFMTDFFLIYRIFISPIQLCKLLILRFQWGLENDDDDRRVVRIRTFVVLRHWLLNYFVHDFTSSRELRTTLTLFLNTLPSHPLIKHSPLDQRIVKSLKRVVQRLKKVHYPSSSQRVQIVAPPPPNFDENQLREIVHDKLSQGPLRRKTEELLFKDITLVNDWHHGNMTFQDARTADIIVVGSSDKAPLPPTPLTPSPPPSPLPSLTSKYDSTGHHDTYALNSKRLSPNHLNPVGRRQRNTSQNSVAKYVTAAFSKKRLQQQELRKVKESYLHRMEQQKRAMMMMSHHHQQISSIRLDHNIRQLDFEQNQRKPSITSGISLDSMITPGITDDELDDALEEVDHNEEEEDDDDSAIVNNTLDGMDNHVEAQQTGSYHAVPFRDNITRRISKLENQPPRRSVYNAVLSDLSPLVSPSGSVIHGPLVHSLGSGNLFPRSKGYQAMKPPHGRQHGTPSSSMDNMLRLPMEMNMDGLVHEKTESAIMDELHILDKTEAQLSTSAVPSLSSSLNHHKLQGKNRVSKALLDYGGENKSALDGETDTQHDEKALVESPTGISIKSYGSLSPKSQNESESTTTSMELQHKLSRRLINAFRSAGNKRPTTATVVQPEMMMSSTIASSIHQNSIVGQSNHRHQKHCNKQDTSSQSQSYQPWQQGYGYNFNNGTEWTPNHSSIIESQTTHQHQQYQQQHQHQHQYPDISYLTNIRASLDEFTYHSPNHIKTEERDHQQVPELYTTTTQQPTIISDNIPPSLSTLFKPALVLQHRSHALAQHFCLVEKWVLLQIDWEELVHCRWTKMGDHTLSMATDTKDEYQKMDDGSTTFYSRQQQQQQQMGTGGGGEQKDGVQQLINRFNMVCRWVSSEIVRTPSLDERVLVIEKFIRLAHKCHMYSNFATLIQILLGLQSPSISRLEKTWSKVGGSEMRLLKQLSSFTSPIKNWKHIRDNMTVVAEEYGMSPKEIQIQLPGSSDIHQLKNQTKIKLPFGGCIPFLGLYLSDLVFNSEQPSYLGPNHDHHKIYQSYTQSSRDLSPALLRQPLVNFRKHRITATVIKQFLTFQALASRYSFEQVDSLYSNCFYLDSLETETIAQLSSTIEPPTSSP